MIYKIGNIGDVKIFPYLPRRMCRMISGLASLLTELYGEDRDVDNSDGGFILYCEPRTSSEELKAYFDYSAHTMESISVEPDFPILIAMYVLNNEYTVVIVMWTDDAPDEIRKEMED